MIKVWSSIFPFSKQFKAQPPEKTQFGILFCYRDSVINEK